MILHKDLELNFITAIRKERKNIFGTNSYSLVWICIQCVYYEINQYVPVHFTIKITKFANQEEITLSKITYDIC